MSPATSTVPVARLSSFYLVYYAALGAFTPYWSLFLASRGMSVTAISVMMSLWYATRVVAPSIWTSAAARSANPIRWLRAGCILTLLTFAAFLLPLEHAWLYPAMVVFCFFYNAVMPQFESITLTHLGGDSHRYGLIRVWGSFGFIAVVSLFGWLIEHHGAGRLPWLMLPLFALLVARALPTAMRAISPHAAPMPRASGRSCGARRCWRSSSPPSSSSCHSARTTRSSRSTWTSTATRRPRWA
jgi:PPP family 3-phenylpropionic acid transporter